MLRKTSKSCFIVYINTARVQIAMDIVSNLRSGFYHVAEEWTWNCPGESLYGEVTDSEIRQPRHQNKLLQIFSGRDVPHAT